MRSASNHPFLLFCAKIRSWFLSDQFILLFLVVFVVGQKANTDNADEQPSGDGKTFIAVTLQIFF